MAHNSVLILAVYGSRRFCRDIKLCIKFPITSWLRDEINSICKYVQVAMLAVGNNLSGAILADRHLAVATLNS
jgi:hypothetical protein